MRIEAVTDVLFVLPTHPLVREIRASRAAVKRSSVQAMAQRRAALPAMQTSRSAGHGPARLLAALQRSLNRVLPDSGSAETVVSRIPPMARCDSACQSKRTLSAADRGFPRYTEGVIRKTLSLYHARLSRARVLLYRSSGQLRMRELDAVVLEGGVTLLVEVKTGLPGSLAAFHSQNADKLAHAVSIAGQIGPTVGLLVEVAIGAPTAGSAETALASAAISAMGDVPGCVSALRLSRTDVEQLGRTRWVTLDEFVRRGEEWRRQHRLLVAPTAQGEAA